MTPLVVVNVVVVVLLIKVVASIMRHYHERKRARIVHPVFVPTSSWDLNPSTVRRSRR
jgi:hypothetical protein